MVCFGLWTYKPNQTTLLSLALESYLSTRPSVAWEVS